MSFFQSIWNLINPFKGRRVSYSLRFAWTGYTKPQEDETMATNTRYPTPKEFLSAIHPAAGAIESKYGIPWLFTATQAAHESRYGNSRLAIDAFNLFGVTGESWKTEGKPIFEITTLEYGPTGSPYTEVRPFRKYASYEECLEDWASLILRRYHQAYEAATKNDFQGFAEGLQSGGYATDPFYATQLVQLHTEMEALA